MTTEEARKLFEAAIVQAETPEQADTRRLLMLYFCDPDFRAGFTQFILARVHELEQVGS